MKELCAIGTAASIIVLAIAALRRPRCETRIDWLVAPNGERAIYWCVFCHRPCSDEDFCRGCKAVICEECDHLRCDGQHSPEDHQRRSA